MGSIEVVELPAQEDSPLSVGQSIGPYRVLGYVGRGAMARVYRARHSILGKEVAIKVMAQRLLQRAEGRRRFLLEGQAAAAVKHPNVVSITDVGVAGELPYLVMELLEGQDLEAHIARSAPLGEEELARIFLPVIAGLSAAHESGVVHRDLKPSNIFLASDAEGSLTPKILDFGISKLAGSARFEPEKTPGNRLLGTPLYMPPEALRGGHELSALSDQYSLGVVLYECATGRRPFEGDDILSLLAAVSGAEFPLPRTVCPGLSPRMEQTILRMMSREPGDRFPHVRAAGRELWMLAAARTQVVWGRSFGLGPFADSQSSRQPTERAPASSPPQSTSSPGYTTTLRSAPSPRDISDSFPSGTLPLPPPSRGRGWVGLGAGLALVLSTWAVFQSSGIRNRPKADALSPNGVVRAKAFPRVEPPAANAIVDSLEEVARERRGPAPNDPVHVVRTSLQPQYAPEPEAEEPSAVGRATPGENQRGATSRSTNPSPRRPRGAVGSSQHKAAVPSRTRRKPAWRRASPVQPPGQAAAADPASSDAPQLDGLLRSKSAPANSSGSADSAAVEGVSYGANGAPIILE